MPQKNPITCKKDKYFDPPVKYCSTKLAATKRENPKKPKTKIIDLFFAMPLAFLCQKIGVMISKES